MPLLNAQIKCINISITIFVTPIARLICEKSVEKNFSSAFIKLALFVFAIDINDFLSISRCEKVTTEIFIEFSHNFGVPVMKKSCNY
jgi:hypothetical protein